MVTANWVVMEFLLSLKSSIQVTLTSFVPNNNCKNLHELDIIYITNYNGHLKTLLKIMQNSTLRVGESHVRTLTKTVVFRVLSTIGVYLLSVSLGISSSGASGLALFALVFGIVAYYTHDRVWNMVKWNRNTESLKESNLRSVVKTITYRIIIFVVSTIVVKVMTGGGMGLALSFAIGNLVINMTLYYILERVANVIRRQRSHV
jgi:uncharacterized membrane protein